MINNRGRASAEKGGERGGHKEKWNYNPTESGYQGIGERCGKMVHKNGRVVKRSRKCKEEEKRIMKNDCVCVCVGTGGRFKSLNLQ